MKKLTNIAGAIMLFIVSVFMFYSCDTNEKMVQTYCTFATRSNECGISKHTNLCFKCNGSTCPEITNKKVWLIRSSTDSCLVALGNKITDCAKCAEGDSIVVLGSIVP